MSDVVWQTLIQSIFGLLGLLIAGYVIPVLHSIRRTGQDTHTLVNKRMGDQLRLNLVMARRLASLPDATDADREAAIMAERLLREHDEKQTAVDNANRGA